MFGFDSKYILLFPSFVVLVSKAKHKTNIFLFFLHTYFQPISQKNKKLNVFFLFLLLLLWFDMVSKAKHQKNTCFFCEILMDHIYSKKEQRVFWCFHFRTKKNEET